MSVEAMGWALGLEGLSPSKKVVLLALANYADHDGKCWPAKKLLSRQTGIGVRHLTRIIHELRKNGVMSIEERKREDGGQSSNIVRLCLTPMTICHPPMTQESPPHDSQVMPPMTPRSPLEPSIEPSENSSGANAPSQRARATRLAEDWTPSEIEIAMAEKEGLTSDEIERTATEFRNFWLAKAGKDAAKLSWPRTWQNWVIRVADRKREELARRSSRPAYVPAGRREPVSFVDILLRDQGASDHGEPLSG